MRCLHAEMDVRYSCQLFMILTQQLLCQSAVVHSLKPSVKLPTTSHSPHDYQEGFATETQGWQPGAAVTVPALFKLEVAFRQHLPHSGPHRSSQGQPFLLETLLEQLLYPRVHNVDSL